MTRLTGILLADRYGSVRFGGIDEKATRVQTLDGPDGAGDQTARDGWPTDMTRHA